MDRTCTRLVALAVLLLAPSPAVAGVEVASIFGPEMVLQREAPVPIWGKADAGEKVSVTFAGQGKAATADDRGRWSLTLGAMPASDQPRPLVVTGATGPVTFQNVRVGEVWLVLSAGSIGKQYTTEGPVPNANTRIRAAGLSGLHNIRRVIQIGEFPLLGTGKTDYRSLVAML